MCLSRGAHRSTPSEALPWSSQIHLIRNSDISIFFLLVHSSPGRAVAGCERDEELPLPSARRPPRTSVWQENKGTEGHVLGDRAEGNPEPVVVSVSGICPQEPPRGLMTWWRQEVPVSESPRWDGKRDHQTLTRRDPEETLTAFTFNATLPMWTCSISAVGHCCPFLGREVCLQPGKPGLFQSWD